MRNEQIKYVIDSRFFRGYCLTSLSDGTHSDYGGETLEELRISERNPYLISVSGKELDKRLRIYEKSLCGSFREITEETYYDSMNVLPPIRLTGRYFFVGEPYSGNLYPFCFNVGGRYFKGLYSARAPKEKLERIIDSHYLQITFKSKVIKGATQVITDKKNGDTLITPYSFLNAEGNERFICNMVAKQNNAGDLHRARKEMADILLSLRKHHFLYFSDNHGEDDIEKFLDEVNYEKQTLLANGRFFQFPINHESVSFTGSIKETGETFFYRIYDRELFQHLLCKLRNVKREKTEIKTGSNEHP
ncbi:MULTISPECIES: hypothetical protein [unclassified Bacteroides]|uniref:hypothetical protein n=1 Tax=unclassified Bacteroides TaxID=2646097 RepID=UPI000E950A77|nr:MULTISPECIES: hypothetical protein [unclassified Bacteroides]RGN59244.1 hypothetical protein DXB58_13975 [Bacteroides sp. OM05-10AA]RGQ65029.1 hypothetical protein DWY87_15135 [Bacteroides sp. AF27-33]